jgi:uncharacterized protein
MAETVIWEKDLPRNTGFVFDLKKGQSVRIRSQTIIDFVCFNRDNLRERFDQARTKANQRKVFISTSDVLVSKLNNTLMTIVEDTFKEGHHDLQEGMCSRKRHELAAARGLWEKTYGRPLSEMPPRGCTENLSTALAPYGIALEDVPSPFNIFQHIDHPSRRRARAFSHPADAAGRACDAARRDGCAGGAQHLPGRLGGRHHRATVTVLEL